MLGLEAIVRQVHEQFNASDAGGCVCVISGSPGSGKTHIAEQFLEDLPETTPKLRGRGLQTGVTPLLPIIEALRSEPRNHNLEQLRAIVQEYATALPVLRDVLGPLLKAREATSGLERGTELGSVLPSETFTFMVLSRLVETFEGEDTPVLLIDDIQWIDASSLAFLAYLAQRLRERRLFLLLIRRQDGRASPQVQSLLESLRHDVGERVTELRVGGLSRSEQRALVTGMLGPIELDEAQWAWLEAHSQGKPYHLRELVAELRSTGALSQERGTWRLQDLDLAPVIPSSLRGHLRRRVQTAALSHPRANDLIHFGACAGTEFDLRVVADALGISALEAAQIAERLPQDTALLRRRGQTTHYRFDHDLTREGILVELGEFARELHVQLAEVLSTRCPEPAAQIAAQYEAGAEELKAATWYARALQRGLDDGHFESAIQVGRRADALLLRAQGRGRKVDRSAVILGIARALHGAERYAEVVDCLREHSGPATGSDSAMLHHLLGRAAVRLPERESHRRAVEHLVSARDALRGAPSLAQLAQLAEIHVDLVNAYDTIGEFAASQAAYRKAIELANRVEDGALLVRLMRLSCIFWRPERVMLTVLQAMAKAEKLGLRRELAMCANNLGSAYYGLGRVDDARARFKQCDELLSQQGGYRRETPLNNLGIIHLLRGELGQAEEYLDQALSRSCDPHSSLFIRSHLGIAAGERGDWGTCVAMLESAVADADASGDLFFRDCLRHNLGNALLLSGHPEQVSAVVQACPLHTSHGEESLVAGKRARLLIRAHEALDQPVEPAWRDASEVLERTTRPQAWLYQMSWYVCDIEFWED